MGQSYAPASLPPVAPPQVLIVAGEASADEHASRALEALKALVPGVRAFGVGGPKLRAAGLEVLFPAEAISVMGFTEVLPKLPRILGILRGVAAAAETRRPQVALLVDLPDFNLRLAARLKRLGVRVVYYISPMIWAWRKGRAKKIARVVDRMLCILPFEEAFYAESGVSARFVGHPFAERAAPAAREHYRAALGLASDRTIIALVPGSRRSELARLLPPMLDAAEALRARHSDAQFVIPVAPTLSATDLQPYLASHASLDVKLVAGRTDDVIGASDAALVKSGTATLEAGLMQRPMVVVYRVSRLSFLVVQLAVRVPHYALVNLLAGKRLVPELIQGDCTAERMVVEVERLLTDESARRDQLEGLAALRASLGTPGAPERVAEELARMLR